MKTILTTLGVAACLNVFSQSSALLSIKTTSAAIAPNGTIELTTEAQDTEKIMIDIKNSDALLTKQYIVTKNIVTLNTGANAYFCFANSCEGFTTNVSGNTLSLTPGQSASSLSNDYMLTADLDEGPSIGYSEVEYIISEVNKKLHW